MEKEKNPSYTEEVISWAVAMDMIWPVCVCLCVYFFLTYDMTKRL